VTAPRPLVPAWNGGAGKKFYLAFWLPLTAVLWGGCFILAARHYRGYEITNHDVSFLGDPGLNPKGWWFWSMGMGVAALMTFSPIAYTCRRMKLLSAGQVDATGRLVSLGSICMHCASFGMAGLALVPQGSKLRDLVHIISGVFAFGGLYVTLLFLWGPALFKFREMSAARLTFFTVSAWWAVVGFLTTQGYRYFVYGEVGHDLKRKGESIFLRFSLWEWMLFAAVTTAFATLVALLPPALDPDKQPGKTVKL
jgi:hypothetical protein